MTLYDETTKRHGTMTSCVVCAGQLPTGVEAAGPMAVFHNDFSATMVVSAFSSFMVAAQEFVPVSPDAPSPPCCNVCGCGDLQKVLVAV